MLFQSTCFSLHIFAIAMLLNACADTDIPSYTTSSLYVFGDSLSDVGNASIASAGLVPDKNYYKGRFSNGPNYADNLANKLGTPLNPSRAFGSGYAFGGVRSIAVNAQVSNYKTNADDQAKPDATYIIWSGANDLLDILQNPQSDSTVSDAISHIESAVRKLSTMGAKKIVVPNQINMSLLPRIIHQETETPGIGESAAQLSVQFNTELDIMLEKLAVEENIPTIQFDVAALFGDVNTHPDSYALTNVTDACYIRDELKLGPGADSSICSNSEAYLFWDNIHPSAVAHAIIAEQLFDQLSN